LGFVTRRKGFQKLFENAFEILEKEKKIGIYLFSAFGPKAFFSPSLAQPAFPFLFGPKPSVPSSLCSGVYSSLRELCHRKGFSISACRGNLAALTC
jgi:hypothetical protein